MARAQDPISPKAAIGPVVCGGINATGPTGMAGKDGRQLYRRFQDLTPNEIRKNPDQNTTGGG